MPRPATLTAVLLLPLLVVAISAVARPQAPAADDAKHEAIRKDHLAIEGTWKAVSIEINGTAIPAGDVAKIRIENGRDGEWTVLVDGAEVAEGTSTIDPTVTPKTIDFKITRGNDAGRETYGIYELTDTTRRLCIAEAGRPRPADFSCPAGSGRTLAVFERVEDQ